MTNTCRCSIPGCPGSMDVSVGRRWICERHFREYWLKRVGRNTMWEKRRKK